MSLDPTHRIWATDVKQYMPPQPLGLPMRAAVLGVVEESKNESFKVGAYVSCFGAWASHCVINKEGAAQAQVVQVCCGFVCD